jgi:hypothetical protein
MSNRYVGLRYVPKPCGTWDNTKNTPYERLSVVYYGGTSYTSSQDVPVGIDILNTTYWQPSADYNAQMEIYKTAVDNYQTSTTQSLTALTTQNTNISKIVNDITVDVTTFGAIGDGVTDDTTAIQNAFNYVVNHGGGQVLFPKGTYLITSTLTWDIYLVSIIGQNAVFLANINDITKYAIRLLSSAPCANGESPKDNTVKNHGGFKLTTTNPTCNGIDVTGILNTNKNACFTLQNIYVDGFANNINFGIHAYAINIMGCTIQGASVSGINMTAATDMGERISFINCNITENQLAFNNPTTQQISCINCSIDWNVKFAINSGMINCTACHIESPSYNMIQANVLTLTNAWYIGSGTSSLIIDNSRITLNYGTANILKYLMVLKDLDTEAQINNCNTDITNVSYLATGSGKAFVSNPKLFNKDSYRFMLMDNNRTNLLSDGSFANSTIIDNWVAVGGATGAGTLVTTDVYETNAHSLQMIHQYQGSTASLSITSKVPSNKRIFGIDFKYMFKTAGNFDYINILFYDSNNKQVGATISISTFNTPTINQWGDFFYTWNLEGLGYNTVNIDHVVVSINTFQQPNNTTYLIGDCKINMI